MRKIDFLIKYGKEKFPPRRWEDLLGVEICDYDGFPDLEKPVTLMEFVEGYCECTVNF